MKKFLILFLVFLLFSPPFSAVGGENPSTLRAYSFLKVMYIPEIGLLREHWGDKRCWLYNDNYLAYKILSGHKEYQEITSNIEKVFKYYNISLQGNGRIEILFNESIDSSTKVGEAIYLEYKNGYHIFTEISKSPPLDWDKYGDLVLYKVIESFRKNDENYIVLWSKAKDMFDGFGIRDKITKNTNKYETYKLALFLFTANILKDDSINKEVIIEILSKLQDEDGGFITHYDKSFNWLGFSNVETTCFVILALESFS